MHVSVPVSGMELINETRVSPFVNKCNVKVCYVGPEPNRNGTVITKDVAEEMGKTLPGSPIVGYFNEETNDFEGHEKDFEIKDGKLNIIEKTKPYGFIPTDAKVWFQKFTDDGVEHEYLVTECYLWTKAYPESKRIIEHGNNQSMELDPESQEGFWTNAVNSGRRIFIYNEALIEKLCILGEKVEPCFEGAQFATFALNAEQLRTEMYSMMTELQEILNKGGSQETMVTDTNDFEKSKNPNPDEEDKTNQNPSSQLASKEEDKDKEKQKNKGSEESSCGGNKKKYNLEEVTEYQELMAQYTELQGKFTALQQEKATLDAEVVSLRQFKLDTDRKDKQSMIDSFYMLNDEQKKDVIDHMDTYSLDDIEAKLSIICVRNKVDFSSMNEKSNEQDNSQQMQGLYNFQSGANDNGSDWMSLVRANANKR